MDDPFSFKGGVAAFCALRRTLIVRGGAFPTTRAQGTKIKNLTAYGGETTQSAGFT
jgi:hypothetical protein